MEIKVVLLPNLDLQGDPKEESVPFPEGSDLAQHLSQGETQCETGQKGQRPLVGPVNGSPMLLPNTCPSGPVDFL